MKGLPESDPARVVRENPNKKGWLVVGTETGLFYSGNDGESWTAIKSEFPTVPIYDVKFVKKTHDLLVATHGRGLFVMDNITPIEDFSAEVQTKDLHVFPTFRRICGTCGTSAASARLDSPHRIRRAERW